MTLCDSAVAAHESIWMGLCVPKTLSALPG